jgi:mRNA interferase MazF
MGKSSHGCFVASGFSSFGDWLVCGISSQLQHAVPNFDEVISTNDPDYSMSGLKRPSIVRLGFLTSSSSFTFLGRIGSISPERHNRLLNRLSQFLRPKS